MSELFDYDAWKTTPPEEKPIKCRECENWIECPRCELGYCLEYCEWTKPDEEC